jgi:hypothetical protein
MKKTAKKQVSAEQIAQLADEGKNISGYFTNQGQMMPPIQRVNVDFTQSMLGELDEAAKDLNISRQAVIKTFLRQGLDQRYTARESRARQTYSIDPKKQI